MYIHVNAENFVLTVVACSVYIAWLTTMLSMQALLCIYAVHEYILFSLLSLPDFLQSRHCYSLSTHSSHSPSFDPQGYCLPYLASFTHVTCVITCSNTWFLRCFRTWTYICFFSSLHYTHNDLCIQDVTWMFVHCCLVMPMTHLLVFTASSILIICFYFLFYWLL